MRETANPAQPRAPLVALVMGVSGAGKTSVGEALARALDARFQDADALHPDANIAKMKAGVALTDSDRGPWLAAVKAWIDATLAVGERGVVACSALRRTYRLLLRGGDENIIVVYLTGDADLIRQRLRDRGGHFMPPALLDSQFATLEPPTPDEHAILVDVAWPIEQQVRYIIERLPTA